MDSMPRFVRNPDGTVLDNLLNVVWLPTLSERMTWKEAKKACEDMGARLPTTQELFSISDLNKDPAFDKDIFPDTKTDDWYWTGDTCPWNSDYARIVNFSNGLVNNSNKVYRNYVRPVRSSQ